MVSYEAYLAAKRAANHDPANDLCVEAFHTLFFHEQKALIQEFVDEAEQNQFKQEKWGQW